MSVPLAIADANLRASAIRFRNRLLFGCCGGGGEWDEAVAAAAAAASSFDICKTASKMVRFIGLTSGFDAGEGGAEPPAAVDAIGGADRALVVVVGGGAEVGSVRAGTGTGTGAVVFAAVDRKR